MKQRIAIRLATPDANTNFKLLAIYQSETSLLVIAQALSNNLKDFSTSEYPSFVVLEEAVVVETQTQEKLPTVAYLTGMDKNFSATHIGNSGQVSNSAAENLTHFLPIKDSSDISNLLLRAKCLYQCRNDGMMALRWRRAQQAPMLIANNMVNENKSAFTSILNLHIVDDYGTLKLVLETIHHESVAIKRIDTYLRAILTKLPRPPFSLDDDFCMTTDDQLHFRARYVGKQTHFITHAYELTLPIDQPTKILSLLCVLDAVVTQISAFQHIQISSLSVLNYFTELYLAAQQTHANGFTIENELSICMENFVTLSAMNKLKESLLSALLLKCQAHSKYADLSRMLKECSEVSSSNSDSIKTPNPVTLNSSKATLFANKDGNSEDKSAFKSFCY